MVGVGGVVLACRLRSGARALVSAWLVALVVLAASPPASAGARAGMPISVGIGDQGTAMFGDPLFDWLGVRTARYVMPWNAEGDAVARARVDTWLADASAAGVRPVIAFGRTWDAAGRIAPPVARYRLAFRRFRAAHPEVVDFVPWNEPNHPKQPTWRRPDLAARLYNAMRRECPACTIAAGDVLDTPGMTAYVKAYQRVLVEQPTVWAMHNYGDAYGRKSTATRQLLRITQGRLWLTETGGVIRRPRGRAGVPLRRRLAEAAGATRYILRLAVAQPRIVRVYLYQWRADPAAAWDSALLSPDSRWRPAFKVLAQFQRRDVTHAPRPAGRS